MTERISAWIRSLVPTTRASIYEHLELHNKSCTWDQWSREQLDLELDYELRYWFVYAEDSKTGMLSLLSEKERDDTRNAALERAKEMIISSLKEVKEILTTAHVAKWSDAVDAHPDVIWEVLFALENEGITSSAGDWLRLSDKQIIEELRQCIQRLEKELVRFKS